MNWLKWIFGIRDPVYFLREFSDKIPHKVWEWRQRNGIPEFKNQRHELVDAKRIYKHTKKHYRFRSDWELYKRVDYWPSYAEIERNRAVNDICKIEEDCDGFAITMHHLLFRQGFPEDEIGIVYCHRHMFAVWHDPKIRPDFWIFDNGYLTRRVKKASSIFPCERVDHYINKVARLSPKWGFNFKSYWKYKEINE